MIRVLLVFGTRPEAIKMAPLILGMAAASKKFAPIVCVTGQHREMLQQVLKTFSIKPAQDLAVMKSNQSLANMTGRILKRVNAVIAKEQPDLVMVQGDTTTAFAASLAAFYHRVPVAHVEAGLRTGSFEHPFPEELNRVLIDRFATFCFAPTELNRDTLLQEGIPRNRVFLTGNTGIDALLMIQRRVAKKKAETWDEQWGKAKAAVHDSSKKLLLITMHRRESLGRWMRAMFQVIANVARKHSDWNFIYPVHLNPNVRVPAMEILDKLHNVHLIGPLAYEPFVFLMNRAALILTDSGGIQEEAPSLGKPVIVVRKRTERAEAVKAGGATLIGNTGRGLGLIVEKAMCSAEWKSKTAKNKNPFGDGHAAERILEIISKQMSCGEG